MATWQEHFNALPDVNYMGKRSDEHKEKVARELERTGVQPAHYVGRVSSFNAVGRDTESIAGGAGLYTPRDRKLYVAGNFHPAFTRTMVHEIGHAVHHALSGAQFGQMLRTPQGHARVEASAENFADQHLPGSFSKYDHLVQSGSASFDPAYYRDARGRRFGNIDPRVA
jgi:hypothetical protein